MSTLRSHPGRLCRLPHRRASSAVPRRALAAVPRAGPADAGDVAPQAGPSPPVHEQWLRLIALGLAGATLVSRAHA
jgi:hypothetical protein